MIKAGWLCGVAVERVNIKALLRHESVATTLIDIHVG